LLISWFIFPVLIGAVALGCGLLLEQASGTRLPGVLIMPGGLAVVVVIGLFFVATDATASLATPVLVFLAAAGFTLTPPWRRGRIDLWAVACAAAVFAIYAAPIVLSGEATFAGYSTQVDQSTYFGLADRILDHGRSLAGLPDGHYREILSLTLSAGYPLGSVLPLGVGTKLTGVDPAWLFQPYLAFLAAMLALSLYAFSGRIISSPPLRALAAFVASQPALLFGFSLWAGVKELSGAWIIALLASLAVLAVRDRWDGRALLPLAVAAAAVLGVLSFAGGIWLVAPLALALFLIVRLHGRETAIRQATWLLIAAAVLSLPSLVLVGKFWEAATSSAITGDVTSQLFHPLSWRQAFGIWPVGDFRATPDAIGIVDLLIGLVGISAVAALIAGWRRREWEIPVYLGGVTAGCLIVTVLGSPWVDAKAFAITSPAIVVAAMSGGAMVARRAGMLGTAVLVAVIGAGVLWSNALAYHDVSLASRDQLEELEEIGDRISAEGQTLLSDHDSYAARHFLRKANVHGPSGARPFTFPHGNGEEGMAFVDGHPVLRSITAGQNIGTGFSFDIAEMNVNYLLGYRTLVRRQSPRSFGERGETASTRPPSIYKLIWRGRYWEVWQQRAAAPEIRFHKAFGGKDQPTGRADCKTVAAFRDLVGPYGQLVAARSGGLIEAQLSGGPSWTAVDRNSVLPPGVRSGVIRGRVSVPKAGTYSAWVSGLFHRRVELSVGGRSVGKSRTESSAADPLSFFTHYVPLGTMKLPPGLHSVALRYTGGASLKPGTGPRAAVPRVPGKPLAFSFGPLVLTHDSEAAPLAFVRASAARSLCGKRWDWIEVLGPPRTL
jgi:hypothetical protein